MTEKPHIRTSDVSERGHFVVAIFISDNEEFLDAKLSAFEEQKNWTTAKDIEPGSHRHFGLRFLCDEGVWAGGEPAGETSDPDNVMLELEKLEYAIVDRTGSRKRVYPTSAGLERLEELEAAA